MIDVEKAKDIVANRHELIGRVIVERDKHTGHASLLIEDVIYPHPNHPHNFYIEARAPGESATTLLGGHISYHSWHEDGGTILFASQFGTTWEIA